LEFTFAKPAQFVDMESGRELYVDPDAARVQYRRNFERHADELARACRDLGVDFYTLPTSQPLEMALYDFLQARQQVGRRLFRSGSRAGSAGAARVGGAS
jgi:hypothetical protein